MAKTAKQEPLVQDTFLQLKATFESLRLAFLKKNIFQDFFFRLEICPPTRFLMFKLMVL